MVVANVKMTSRALVAMVPAASDAQCVSSAFDTNQEMMQTHFRPKIDISRSSMRSNERHIVRCIYTTIWQSLCIGNGAAAAAGWMQQKSPILMVLLWAET